MQELYYGRHGQTKDLAAGRRSRPDTNLTLLGWDEARHAGELLVVHGILPVAIVSSELPRSVQSAVAVAKAVGYNTKHILRSHLLNERDWGQATGVLNSEIAERWPKGFNTIPGVETVEALQQRAALAISWLRGLDANIVFVIGHGTIGRAIVREFEGRPYTDEYKNGRLFQNGQIMRLYPQPTTLIT